MATAPLRTIGSLFLALCCPAAGCQPLIHAHAHNDYEHTRPLFDALHYGFTSVEADIYLIDGKLIVSHVRPIFKSVSLEGLYLAPLDSLVRTNNGKVYPGYDGPFYLMIDIKSDAESAYAALKATLRRYPALFNSSKGLRPVTIFLSGNRPVTSVLHDPDSMVSLDGRPKDLGNSYSAAVMPVISDTYRKWSDWNGKGIPGPDDLLKVRNLAIQVHAEGKKLRLWAIPDNPNTWKELLKAGVDLINTDKLKDLNAFLKSVNN